MLILDVHVHYILSTVNGVLLFVEKDGKALKLKYQDKLRLVAYTKQATFGKYRNDVSPEVGFLDVVGNDRR